MLLSSYIAICAATNFVILVILLLVLALLRKNGKSDLRQSRIIFVVTSFVLPVFTTSCFVFTTIILQRFYGIFVPIGTRGGGVFVVLAATVGVSILSLLLLLPLIRHKQ